MPVVVILLHIPTRLHPELALTCETRVCKAAPVCPSSTMGCGVESRSAHACVQDSSSEESLTGTMRVLFWPLFETWNRSSRTAHGQCLLFRQPTALDRFVRDGNHRFTEAATLRRRHISGDAVHPPFTTPESDCGVTCIAAGTLAEPASLLLSPHMTDWTPRT